mgnify:CR=1 FL=1
MFKAVAAIVLVAGALPAWAQEGDSAAIVARLQNPASRARILNEMKDRKFDTLKVASVNLDYDNKLLTQIAAEMKVTPAEALLNILVKQKGEGFQIGMPTGARAKIDPTLILAIMAIESGFNPFAQSSVGAQGLMQVMTKIHSDKYMGFGGKLAAFDPVSNLRVGVKVLQECVARAGSIEGGLKLYVGAGNLEDDGGYTAKVLAEHNRLLMVSNGRSAPVAAPQMIPVKQAPVVQPEAAPEVVASVLNS